MLKVEGLQKVNDYKKVINDASPSFSGIVSGECRGNLWVDHLDNPNIALVESYSVESFAFLGEIVSDKAYRDLDTFIKEELFSYLKTNGINNFEFSIEESNSAEIILKLFEDKEIQQEKEYKFRKTDRVTEIHRLEEGYTLHRVDHALWSGIYDGKIENGSFLSHRILGSWANFYDFFKKSLAFCIIHANKIIAVIVGTARFNDTIPIDIETDEAHRRKGLGLIMTSAFVNECLNIGITPQWDCMETNSASQRLAKKAGFTFIKYNDVYWFDI